MPPPDDDLFGDIPDVELEGDPFADVPDEGERIDFDRLIESARGARGTLGPPAPERPQHFVGPQGDDFRADAPQLPEPVETGFEEPGAETLAEGLGRFVADRPTLQRALSTFATGFRSVPNFISGTVNVGKALGSTLTGDLDAAGESLEDAGERFTSSARSLADAAANIVGAPLDATAHLAKSTFGIGSGNIVPDFARPEDVRTSSDILGELRVPHGPVVSTSVVAGRQSLRDIASFGLDIFIDPFKFTRVGQLTPAGRVAAQSGNLIGPAISRTGVVGSRLGAQARAGQRALLTIGETPVIRGAPVFEALTAADRGIRAFARQSDTLREKLVQFPRRAFRQQADRSRARGAEAAFAADQRMAETWQRAEQFAEAQGIPLDEAYDRFVEGVERGGRRAAQESLRRNLGGEADVVRRRISDVEDRVNRVTEPANKRADALAAQADEIVADMRRRSEDMKLAEDRARNGISAEELRVERAAEGVDPRTGRPSSPQSGVKPNPKKANAIKRRRAVMERTLQNQATRLRQQAESTRKAATAKADEITKKAGLERSRSKLAEIETEIGNVPELPRLAQASPETRSRARALAQRFQAQGFSRFEAVRAARAVTMLGVDETMAPFAARFMGEFRDIIRNEKNLGLVVSNLTDPGNNYITRVLTDEAVLHLKQTGKLEAARARVNNWHARHGSTARRKAIYEGKTIPEINRWLRDNVDGFEGKLFETDPAVIARRRSERLGRAARSSDYARAMAEDYGRVVPQELIDAELWVPMRQIMDDVGLRPDRPAFLGGERVPTKLGDVADLAVPAEVADALRQTLRVTNDRATPGLFVRYMDAMNTLFKTTVTRAFPSFFVRNFTSDGYANFLANVGIDSYQTASRLLDDAVKGGSMAVDLVLDGRPVTLSSAQVLDLLKRNRVLGGQIGEAGSITVTPAAAGAGIGERIVSGAERFAAGTARALDRAGQATAGRIPGVKNLATMRGEALHRVAHFMDRVRKGDSVADAVLSTKKYLFDYSDLSPIEKTYLRRLVPFYTWVRKNTPLQIESLVTKPGKVSKVAIYQSFIQNGEGEGGMNATAVPPWERRRLFGFSPNAQSGVDTFGGFGIGLEDLAIFDAPLREFAAMLRPEVKGVTELATGRDLFSGLDLVDADRAPSVLRHLRHAPGGQSFLDWLGFRPDRGPTGEVIGYRADPILMRIISSIPGVAAGSRVASTAGRIEDQLAARRPETNETLRFLTGLRSTTLGKEEAIVNNLRNLMVAVDQRIDVLKREGFETSVDRARRLPRAFVEDPRQKHLLRLVALQRRTQQRLKKLDRSVRISLRKQRRAAGSLRSGGQ